MPIEIGADIDARSFIAGTDDMAEALENVEDAVKEVQKDGDKSLEKLEKSFAEVAKASRDAGDDIKKGVGKGTKEATKDADEGLKDLKENSKANAKEVAASFDGSIQGIADGFQGLAAEAFEGFGPAGVAASVAAGIGIGLISQSFIEAEEAAKKTKEQIAELGEAFIESGRTAATAEKYSEALTAIATNADDAAVKIEDLRKESSKLEKAGLQVEQVAQAFAGNDEAIKATVKSLKEYVEQQKQENIGATRSGDGLQNKTLYYQELIKKLEAVTVVTTGAAKAEQDFLAAGGPEAKAKAGLIEQINNAYDEGVDSINDYYDAETKTLDIGAWVAMMKEKEQRLKDYQEALSRSKLTPQQKIALNKYGVDQAAAILKGLEDPNVAQDQKDYLIRSLGESAKAASGAALQTINQAFAKPIDATIAVNADITAADVAINRWANQKTVRLNLEGYARNGQRVI